MNAASRISCVGLSIFRRTRSSFTAGVNSTLHAPSMIDRHTEFQRVSRYTLKQSLSFQVGSKSAVLATWGRRKPPVDQCSLDVGEEEGDGAAGQIGHCPLQILGWTWCCPIVARGHGNQARGSSNHYARDPGVRNGENRSCCGSRRTMESRWQWA